MPKMTLWVNEAGTLCLAYRPEDSREIRTGVNPCTEPEGHSFPCVCGWEIVQTISDFHHYPRKDDGTALIHIRGLEGRLSVHPQKLDLVCTAFRAAISSQAGCPGVMFSALPDMARQEIRAHVGRLLSAHNPLRVNLPGMILLSPQWIGEHSMTLAGDLAALEMALALGLVGRTP